MAAGEYDFYIEQGATLFREIAWLDGTGVPVDLTGFTARMQIRPSINSDEIIHELTTENGEITIIPLTGVIRIEVSPVVTSSLTQRGVYDLELVNGTDVFRLLQGHVRISKEVTR
jgi:molybdopterin-binding protein